VREGEREREGERQTNILLITVVLLFKTKKTILLSIGGDIKGMSFLAVVLAVVVFP